ncbi:MAG TPA: hypothetical protein VF064_12870, partial [Pyrinomonadaceae bacterium]
FNAFNHTQFRGDSLQNNMNLAGGNVNCAGMPTTFNCSATNRVITQGLKPADAPNPTVPIPVPVNGNFGRSGTTRGPREIQYALKLVF